MAIVALLSDFGFKDWYVASMKAAVLGVMPDAQLVDITHHIPSGDIHAGAFVLSQCWGDFPPRTVFLAVVDPGVGTSRHPVAVMETATGKVFVGPDNGLMSFVMRLSRTSSEASDRLAFQARRIINNTITREPHSNTFHGRDIFAPVAARLAMGFPFEKLGPEHKRVPALLWPEVLMHEGSLSIKVVHVDGFGNCITNATETDLARIGAMPGESQFNVQCGSQRMAVPFAATYGSVSPGNILAYIGSGGLLEFAFNGQSASRLLALNTGSSLQIERRR